MLKLQRILRRYQILWGRICEGIKIIIILNAKKYEQDFNNNHPDIQHGEVPPSLCGLPRHR